MLPFSKKFPLFVVILALPLFSYGQPCSFSISGQVTDKSTGAVLPFATIYLEDTGKGAVSDSAGFFRIENLCQGIYRVSVSHIGCETKKESLELNGNVTTNFVLNHFTEFLNEVVVHGKNSDNTTQISSAISKGEIQKKSNENLADILENIQGVSALRNGAGISKPVVHGLFGNRVSIINNGITQSGQQWGNDHAPEIDPFIADHLAVVKGTSALMYSGSSLGGVVLADMKNIGSGDWLTGNFNYILQSNGWGNTLNTQLEKGGKSLSWRLTGTLKARGDTKAPDYFLTNTGKKEADFALQLEKKWTKKWNSQFYYSLFNTEIGILRGSHIGNVTDLEEALYRDEPFFTKDNFSYNINAPSQKVIHHLLKVKIKFQPTENTFVDFVYGGQLNNRREFDVRRSGRSDIPALSLEQTSHFLQGYLFSQITQNSTIKTGVQGNYTDNTNNPETGILPLIPDYRSYQASAFFIFQNTTGKLFYELGGRYDFERLNVYAISHTLPREIERHYHSFYDFSFSAGAKYPVSQSLTANINVGYTTRSPEINELYSYGLHQGVSGIEEGDPDLTPEKSVKLVFTADWNIRKNMFVQALGYFQQIDNFIYLQPQQELRLTIRGAFPVFIYEQANSRIYGTDWLFSYEPFHGMKFTAKYASVRGWNREQNIPLVNIPPDNLKGTVTWFPESFRKFQKNEISFTGKYVFKQNNLDPDQDFLPPPDGYFLLSAAASTNLELTKSTLKFFFRTDNMLNTTYRDYLNRLRYFADEPGISFTLGVNYSF